MIKKLTALLLCLALLLALAGCGAQTSGNYPKKTITLIVPYTAGGTCDLAARRLAVLMERELGGTVTVVNQGGSSGAIGIQACLDAPADGYTMVMTADSLGTLRVMGLSDGISYDDFTPIAAVVNDPKVIVVAADSAYRTLEDLFGDMKERPGKVKMSYTGPGGSGHVQSLILNALGCEPALTAYPGGSDGLLAVLNGSVDFTNANYSTVADYLRGGTLRCLAVCADERLAAIPEVPALTELCPEAGEYMRFPFTPLILQVRNDVDPKIVELLRAAASKAMETEEWRAYVEESCLEKLYEKYPAQEDVYAFMGGFESLVSWMLYDAGAAPRSPAEFGIPRP